MSRLLLPENTTELRGGAQPVVKVQPKVDRKERVPANTFLIIKAVPAFLIYN